MIKVCHECGVPVLEGWYLEHTNSPSHALGRFMRFVEPGSEPTACWEWRGARYPKGYGVFGLRNRNGYAHRAAHQLFIGPIAAGLTIDHLCRNRGCVNPAHLEAVSIRENILRGLAAQRTECVNGHPYDETNTRRDGAGHRHCRACHRASERRRRARLAAA